VAEEQKALTVQRYEVDTTKFDEAVLPQGDFQREMSPLQIHSSLSLGKKQMLLSKSNVAIIQFMYGFLWVIFFQKRAAVLLKN
jgi:hypothetical protein